MQNCENKLYRTLNLRNEETALNVSILSGLATVPTDFKALKYAYYDASPIQMLQWVSPTELYRDYPTRSTSTTPKVITREGGSFIFGPNAADGTLKGIYYAKQDPLRTTDGSWYVLNAPEVLLYGSLLEAAPFIKDDARLLVWKTLFDEAVGTLRREQSNAETSMGPLAARTDAITQQP